MSGLVLIAASGHGVEGAQPRWRVAERPSSFRDGRAHGAAFVGGASGPRRESPSGSPPPLRAQPDI